MDSQSEPNEHSDPNENSEQITISDEELKRDINEIISSVDDLNTITTGYIRQKLTEKHNQDFSKAVKVKDFTEELLVLLYFLYFCRKNALLIKIMRKV